jgi:hypothetical protein
MSAIHKLVWIIEDMDLPDHVNTVFIDAGQQQFILQMGRGHVLGHPDTVLEKWLSEGGDVLIHPESSKYGRMEAERVFLN